MNQAVGLKYAIISRVFHNSFSAILAFSVGSLAFEKIVQDNRALRHEREILTQKLGKSKSALQETLIRLSKSNLQKQDQVGSPSLQRRGLSQSRSQGGLAGGASRAGTIERDLSLNSILGTKKLAKKS